MTEKTKGNLMLFCVAFMWSFMGVITKQIGTNAVVITGGCGLFSFLFVRFVVYRHHKLVYNKATIMASLAMWLTNLTFFLGNVLTTVTNTIILQYSAPIFVMVITIILDKYVPKKLEIFSLLLCVAGMLVFFWDQLSTGHMLGNIFALSSGVFFAIQFYLCPKPDTDAKSMAMLTSVPGIVLACIYCVMQPSSIPSSTDFLWLALLGIVFSGLPSALYAKAIKMTTGFNASMIELSEVVLVSFWGYLFYKESMGRFSFIGVCMILSAILIVSIVNAKSEDQKL